MKVNLLHSRKGTFEGRNQGIAIGFVDNKLNTICPITPCKDFLNEVVYSEYTGIQIGSIYGFKHPVSGVFKGKRKINLAAAICKQNKDEPYTQIDKVQIKNTVKFINNIETRLNIPKTTVRQIDEFTIFRFSNYWISQVYLISLYGLLIRLGVNYDGTNVLDYYVSKKVPSEDFSLAQESYFNFKEILENKYLDVDSMLKEHSQTGDTHYIHNKLGICSIKKQEEEYVEEEY
jgi:hypothetical protein